MSFDINSAAPVGDEEDVSSASTGFDISTAIAEGEDNPKPVGESPEMPEGNFVDAITEPMQAIGAGIVGSIGGGYEGIKSMVMGGNAQDNAQAVTDTQDSFTEMGAPETMAGKRSLETVQDLLKTGIDWARIPLAHASGLFTYMATRDNDQMQETIKSIKEDGLGKTMGNATLEATESPILSTLAEMSPELVETFLGLGVMRGTKAINTPSMLNPAISTPSTLNPDINPLSKARTQKRVEFKQKIAEDIKSGSTDSSVAKYIIDGAGKVANDPAATLAIKQGFDPSVVAAIKGAPNIDKAKMLEMLEIMESGKTNARYAMDNRPSDVAGRSLMKRVEHIVDINKKSGAELDGVAKNLKGSYADFKPAMASFMESLDSMGVSINPKTLKPDYSSSIIKGLKEPQLAVSNLVDMLATAQRQGRVPDAFEMHKMKKYIDENVAYGGKGGEGLSGKTEVILKSLRRDIDKSLDDAFPEYNRVNTEFSDTRGALDALQDTAGRKMNLGGKNADKATGTLLRRLMSNYSNRVNLYDALTQIDSVSKKYGGRFNDDLKMQMLFADELDSMYGSVARTSLAGETGKAVKKGIKEHAIDETTGKFDKLRGISEEQSFKTMRELLERLDDAEISDMTDLIPSG